MTNGFLGHKPHGRLDTGRRGNGAQDTIADIGQGSGANIWVPHGAGRLAHRCDAGQPTACIHMRHHEGEVKP
jgi:hypothetical protein